MEVIKIFNIFVRGIDEPQDVVEDVHLAFTELTLSGDAMEERIIHTIDMGHFCDTLSFYDRNGAKTRLTHLSSGSKAALLVYHRPNEIINCIEIGSNALSTLFTVTDTGNIVIGNLKYIISDYEALDTTIRYRGYCFSSVKEFGDYLEDLWPEPPTKALMEEYYEDNL